VLSHLGVHKDSVLKRRTQRFPRQHVHRDHVAPGERLFHVLQVVDTYRPHTVKNCVAVEHGIREGHPTSGRRGLRLVVHDNGIAITKQDMGYGRPDVADPANQHSDVSWLHIRIVPRAKVLKARDPRPTTRARNHLPANSHAASTSRWRPKLCLQLPGGSHPSLADYVIGTGATRGATAAGKCYSWLPLGRRRGRRRRNIARR
jgi:hypothetical protein